MAVHHTQFRFKDRINFHGGIGADRARIAETVIQVGEDRILRRNRSIRTIERNFDQISCVHDELRDGAVIRVIVAVAVRQNHIRLELADDADDLLSGCERVFYFAVMMIQHLIFREPRDFCGSLRFCVTAFRESFAVHGLMPAVAVAGGYKFDKVPCTCQFDRGAAEQQVAVIRMCTEDEKFFPVHCSVSPLFEY